MAQTYHVSASGGANHLYLGHDLVSGWPIYSQTNIPVNQEFFVDPHGGGFYNLFIKANTQIASGTGSIKSGTAANYGNYNGRRSRNGSGVAGQENQ